MKAHPRMRKFVKHTSTAASVLLVALFIASAWWSVRCTSRQGTCFGVWMNQLDIEHTNVPPGSRMLFDEGLRFYDHRIGGKPPYFQFGFRYRAESNGWALLIPTWLPALVSISVTAWIWRIETLARRRAELNRCPACRYDRSGLPTGAKCPECGAPGATGA